MFCYVQDGHEYSADGKSEVDKSLHSDSRSIEKMWEYNCQTR